MRGAGHLGRQTGTDPSPTNLFRGGLFIMDGPFAAEQRARSVGASVVRRKPRSGLLSPLRVMNSVRCS
jgi:hypothetical protein